MDENDIAMAREWEKIKKLDYKGDIAHLVFDCISDGEKVPFEIINTEIDEEKKRA